MLMLIKALTAQVRAADPQKVFLASDCLGGVGTNVPGYAMVADGTYQDTAFAPAAWSYGLFPAWRNVLWSCNWWSVTKFNNTRWGVEHFGVPVAISNGWEDDRGPSEVDAARSGEDPRAVPPATGSPGSGPLLDRRPHSPLTQAALTHGFQDRPRLLDPAGRLHEFFPGGQGHAEFLDLHLLQRMRAPAGRA